MSASGGRAPKQKGYRQWRTLDWLPGYEISEDGDVRHTTRKATRPAGYVLKGCVDCEGYRRYKISTPRGKEQLKAHRLVCEAWHGHKRNALHREVAHLDGNKLNNHYSNLKWTSRAENDSHRVAHGTDPKGDRNPRAKFTWDQVRAMRAGFTGRRGEVKAAAEQYGVSISAIAQIRDGRHWRE